MTSPPAPSALNSKANSKDFTAHSPTSHPHPEGTAVVVNAAFTPWSNDEGVAPLPSPSSSSLSGPTLTALIAGIGLGGLFVLIAVGICFCFYRRRKRPEIQLPTTTTTTDAGGNKNPSTEHWHLNVHPPSDNMAASLNKPTVPPRTAHDLQIEMMPSSTQPIPYSTSCSLGPEKKTPGQSSDISLSDSTFTYQELAMATDNFSTVKLLGQGGFGYVHKGVLPTGKEIAVKQLKAGSCQGEREFQAEVETISRVHHRHLVPLVGYCVCGDQRLLVYEFVSNGTLELHLHGNGRPPMSWEARLKIAVGAAKGLAYLHEDCKPKIIHRDIKASNILIDDNFEAKVADFGLAKFCYDNDTHISTRVMGTFGYLAPEYASSGKLTEKSDIFSFGVLLLELITGRRPIDKAASFMDDSLVEWARPLLARALELRVYDGLVDPKLTEYNDSEMAQMIACAVVCVRNSARRRPRMSQIVRALEGNLSIDDLCKETSSDRSTICGSSDFDSGQANKEELMKFRKTAFESGELSTSEFSAVASEYGVQASTSSSLSHDIESGKRIKEEENVREILISGV